MILLVLGFLFTNGYSIDTSELDEVFTVHFEPRALLLENDIDNSYYDLGLLHPSHKNIGLRSLVFIDYKPIIEGPLKLSKANLFLSKREILNDTNARINEIFKIPDNLYQRVSFWFDIYTVYDSNQTIFHDMDRPWITYKVIDITPILEQPNKHKWTKYHESQRFIKQTRKQLIKDLISLSKKTNFNKLSESEAEIFKHYADFKNPRAQLRGAASRLRSQTGQKDHYELGLQRSAPYLAEMEKIFAKNNLPVELTRIPLVESSFNTEAYSKVGASGIWQIMPHIGRHFGMFKNNKDLRSDVYASTNVAAKLLKEKHSILKAWPLSITAYNHGPGGLRAAVKSVKSNDLGKILEKYNSKRFGFASQNFYACFLASLYAERYQDSLFHHLDPVLLGSANETENTKTN